MYYVRLAVIVITFCTACIPGNAVIEDPQILLHRRDWNGKGNDSSTLSLRSELYLQGLNRPLGITSAGDGSRRLFIVEQGGRIVIVEEDRLVEDPFLDISNQISCCGEQGLLGFAVAPDFATSGLLFVSYTEGEGSSVVARYHVSNDPDRADPASGEIIFRLAQPGPQHNGGHIVFGPDRKLYLGLGDGAYRSEPLLTSLSQHRDQPYGKVLRLVVDEQGEARSLAGVEATVPAEVIALGLRNPWRFSFDTVTGELFIADVGQNSREEVNVMALGEEANFGWPLLEGELCLAESCNEEVYSEPVVSYTHDDGCSITGGLVYRGEALPELQGAYLYGDFCFGKIWAASRDESGWQSTLLFETSKNISSFGTDERGEVYFSDYGTGSIYKLVPALPKEQ